MASAESSLGGAFLGLALGDGAYVELSFNVEHLNERQLARLHDYLTVWASFDHPTPGEREALVQGRLEAREALGAEMDKEGVPWGPSVEDRIRKLVELTKKRKREEPDVQPG
jgi:hypothetical protein